MELVQGNIFIRPMAFNAAGDVVQGHSHNFDHTTYIVRGALRFEQLEAPTYIKDEAGEDVTVPGKVLRTIDKRASDGNNFVLIRAECWHRVTALEDNSLGHCIYAHRTAQGDVVQEYDGWTPGYV